MIRYRYVIWRYRPKTGPKKRVIEYYVGAAEDEFFWSVHTQNAVHMTADEMVQIRKTLPGRTKTMLVEMEVTNERGA